RHRVLWVERSETKPIPRRRASDDLMMSSRIAPSAPRDPRGLRQYSLALSRRSRMSFGRVRNHQAVTSVADDNPKYPGESSPSVLARVPAGAARILDGGSGGNARLLSAQGVTVDGVTLSAQEAAQAAAYCAEVYVHDLEKGLPDLPPGRLYDAVICSHVLEH